MWFGNLVTPPWWDDLWLKEGFATWGTPLVLTLLEPDAAHDVSAAARSLSAMATDSLASTRAIREPIEENSNIRNAYDAITYSKSLGVIHMIDQFFGPEVFRPALGRYVAAYADGVADSERFYSIMASETKTPALADVLRSFVEQQGVPQVQAELVCEAGKASVQLRQQRYAPLGSTIDPQATRWSLPICLRTAAGHKQCTIMSQTAQTLAIEQPGCPEWVLPNTGGNGYYRWNVPAPQWQLLLQNIASMSATEALSVIDSAIAAFEAGQLSGQLFWEAIAASSVSPYRQVVALPLTRLGQYQDHYFQGADREAFNQRLATLYLPALARALASAEPEQQILATNLQSFLALVAKDPAIRAQLSQRAQAFTGFDSPADPDALSSDLYQSALTVAVQDLGGRFVRHLVKTRQQLDDPRFESASALALGRVIDPALLADIRSLALSEEMGSREAYALLMATTATPTTRIDNWRWIREHFEQVLTKIPAQWRRRTPAFASALCSREALTQLQDLFAEHGTLAPGYQRSLDQTRERLQLCMALAPVASTLTSNL
jgi:aminopeptidase N